MSSKFKKRDLCAGVREKEEDRMTISKEESIQGNTKDEGQCRERNLTETCDHQQELPELSSELLELIAKRLDVIGFCAFGAVCKNWWEIYVRCKEEFLESQAPMVVLIAPHCKNACYLFHLCNGNTKEVMLPIPVQKFFIGCSTGYMIIQDMNNRISLFNPLTGHALNFHTPHFTLQGKFLYDHNIFISTLSSGNNVILVISSSKHEVQVFHSRDMHWYTGLVFGQPWVDITIFKEQVYVITGKAEIGKLRLKASNSTNRVFSWLTVKNTPNVNSQDLKLVVSDNQLLVVDFVPNKYLNIHKIDFDLLEWVKLDELGDEAIFLENKWGSRIMKPSKWGGKSNCMYHLETLSSMCCIYSMEAKLIDKFSLVKNPTSSKLFSHGWYYPHQFMKAEGRALSYE